MKDNFVPPASASPVDFMPKEMPAGKMVYLSVKGETSDNVNHPPHYNSHPSGVECIDITRHMCFNLGNAMKYIWRADLKGAPIEDLEKAVFYLQDEIALRRTGGR